MSYNSSSSSDITTLQENPAYLQEQLITYIGNKRSLLNFIGQGIALVQKELGKEKLSIFDCFSGSGVVARYLRQFADQLWVNDLERYSYVINSCYQANKEEADTQELRSLHQQLCQQLENQPLEPGFISKYYAPVDDTNIQPGERCFYTTRNANFLDTARRLIAQQVPPNLQDYFLAPLISQASIHANTSGVFKGFYKNKEGLGQFGGTARDALQRIAAPITLPYPIFSNFSCSVDVMQKEAQTAAEQLDHLDMAYLDPPYNQHPYGSNYFMLNLLATGRAPAADDLSPISGIPKNWNRSHYNKARYIKQALEKLITTIPASFLLISFNSEGFIKPDEMENLLTVQGKIQKLECNYNTFRGSRNLHNRNIHVTEYLYVVDKR